MNDELAKIIRNRNIKDLTKYYYNSVPVDGVDKDGNNILHLAAKTNNAGIVKAVLLLFERTHRFSTKRNNRGRLPRDESYSPEISEAIKVFTNFRPVLRKDEDKVLDFEEKVNEKNINYQRFERDTSHKERSILLSLDGGGIRGLVLVQILMYLEERLGSNIFKKFNWVSGTSTGGILALTLATGKSLETCRMLYLKLKEDIFAGKTKPYDSLKLEESLKFTLGYDKMSAIKNVKVVIPTCLANVSPPVLKLYRNFAPQLPPKDLESFGYDDPDSIYIWKAARCSSAAPLFFSAVEDKYVDGGLMANNPILELLTDFIRYQHIKKRMFNEHVPPMGCVISLGTGESPTNPIGIGRAHAMLKAVSKKGAEIKSMLTVGLRQLTEADGQPIDRAQAWCWSMNVPFFRFSPMLGKRVEMDEYHDPVLLDMLWSTELYMRNESVQVEQFLRILKELS